MEQESVGSFRFLSQPQTVSLPTVSLTGLPEVGVSQPSSVFAFPGLSECHMLVGGL